MNIYSEDEHLYLRPDSIRAITQLGSTGVPHETKDFPFGEWDEMLSNDNFIGLISTDLSILMFKIEDNINYVNKSYYERRGDGFIDNEHFHSISRTTLVRPGRKLFMFNITTNELVLNNSHRSRTGILKKSNFPDKNLKIHSIGLI